MEDGGITLLMGEAIEFDQSRRSIVLCEDEKQTVAVKSQLQQLARPMYSNPVLQKTLDLYYNFWILQNADCHNWVNILKGGLMLGPSFLGQSKEFTRIVFPDRGKVVLETFGLFGFTIFQFLIGVKMDHNIILQSGRRAIAIGILGYIIPLTFGVLAAIVLRIFVNVDASVSRVLSIVVGTESMSAFPVITCFLSDLKILNSDLGRLASSSSLISDICSVVSIVIFKISFMLKGEKAFANTLGSITSAAFLLAIAVFLVRPAALWVIKKTPEGKPVREIYLCSFIMLLLAFTFVSQITGQGYVMAPFIFGLALPYGPPLGSALEEKFDCFISVLLMPIFYTLCGLKTDFFTLDGNVNKMLKREIICILLSLRHFKRP